MDAYLARHVNNPRNQLSIYHSDLAGREPPSLPLWQPLTATNVERFNASAKEYGTEKKSSKAGSKAGSKKKKRKRSSGGSVTSDGTDAGSCWSNYKRTSGYKKGSRAKGSCIPK